jgi:hypothetical protein
MISSETNQVSSTHFNRVFFDEKNKYNGYSFKTSLKQTDTNGVWCLF